VLLPGVEKCRNGKVEEAAVLLLTTLFLNFCCWGRGRADEEDKQLSQSRGLPMGQRKAERTCKKRDKIIEISKIIASTQLAII
jgi:hypothetical protein